MSKRKKDDREHWTYEEIKKIQKFKFEFAKRNKKIISLLEQLEQAESLSPRKQISSWDAVRSELVRVFHFHPTETDSFIMAMRSKEKKPLYSLMKISSINVIFPDKSGNFYTIPLDYYEADLKNPMRNVHPRVVEAINAREGTIAIEIKFFQNSGKIHKDVNFLLGLLSRELLKLHNIKLNELKRRFDDYENYLKAWDYKEKDGWNYMKIARALYQGEEPKEARTKVKSLLGSARKMIDGGFILL